MIVSIGSLGPIISAWIYLPSDGYVHSAPLFRWTGLDWTCADPYTQAALHQGPLRPAWRPSRHYPHHRTFPFARTPSFWPSLERKRSLRPIGPRQVFLIFWLMRENKLRRAGKRDARLDADDDTVAMLGNEHPKFRLTL
jgi:hypothetical protein